MAKMENLQILSLICYFMIKGCNFEATNKAGVKAADVLIGIGCPKSITQTLNRFVAQFKNEGSAVGTVLCMGRINGCVQTAEFHLFCPHKSSFKACSVCFPLTFKREKCGCPNEDIAIITTSGSSNKPTQLEDVAPTIVENEVATNGINQDGVAVKEQDPLHDFEWSNGDASKHGCVKDKRGNKFIYSGIRKVGGEAVGYRCTTVYEGDRCTAVARSTVNAANGMKTIKLEKPYTHG